VPGEEICMSVPARPHLHGHRDRDTYDYAKAYDDVKEQAVCVVDVHLALIHRRLLGFEHLQHAVGDDKSADNINSAQQHCSHRDHIANGVVS
jgi:hypothetical protein